MLFDFIRNPVINAFYLIQIECELAMLNLKDIEHLYYILLILDIIYIHYCWSNKLPHINYNINVIVQENYILHLLYNPKLQRILLVCETWIE